MDFKAKDFDGLTYKVFNIPDDTIFDVYPILEVYFGNYDLSPKIEVGKILKYIIFLYDKNTPLSNIEGFVKRRVKAISYAEFPKKKGKYDQEYLAALESEEVNRMTIKYCRIQKSLDFSQLVNYEELFYKELEETRTEKDATKRTAALKNVDTLKIRIKEIEVEILNQDKSPDLLKYLYDEVENEALGLKPEQIAMKMKSNKEPLGGFNPYLK